MTYIKSKFFYYSSNNKNYYDNIFNFSIIIKIIDKSKKKMTRKITIPFIFLYFLRIIFSRKNYYPLENRNY